jgi:translation initiation factor 2 subunit 2
MDYKELLKKARKNLPETVEKARFEMPVASIFSTKRQTVVRNFSEIAKTIRRDPKHIAKFLFKELAVPGNIVGDELILQTKVNSSILNQRLNTYVSEFVICKECGKPDTSIDKQDYFVVIKCEACGARRTVKN